MSLSNTWTAVGKQKLNGFEPLVDPVPICQTPLREPLFQNVRSIRKLPRELNPQLISFQTFQSERAFPSHEGEMSESFSTWRRWETCGRGLIRRNNYISIHSLLFFSSSSRSYCAVYKPDRAWQPISQPGAGVPMGQHAAAPRPGPRRVPRPRHLPHKARFWSRRYARYCIFLDRGLCRLKCWFLLKFTKGLASALAQVRSVETEAADWTSALAGKDVELSRTLLTWRWCHPRLICRWRMFLACREKKQKCWLVYLKSSFSNFWRFVYAFLAYCECYSAVK